MGVGLGVGRSDAKLRPTGPKASRRHDKEERNEPEGK